MRQLVRVGGVGSFSLSFRSYSVYWPSRDCSVANKHKLVSGRGSYGLAHALVCQRKGYFINGMRLVEPFPWASEGRVGTAFHALRIRQLVTEQMKSPPDWAKEHPKKLARKGCLPSRLTQGEWKNALEMWKKDRSRRIAPADWRLVDAEATVQCTLGDLGCKDKRYRHEIVMSRLDLVYENPHTTIVDIKGEKTGYKTKELQEFDPEHPKWQMHWQAMVNLIIAEVHYKKPIYGWYAYRVGREEPYNRSFDKVEIPATTLEDAKELIIEAAILSIKVKEQGDEYGYRNVSPTGYASGACYRCGFRALCTAENQDIFDSIVEHDLLSRGG